MANPMAIFGRAMQAKADGEYHKSLVDFIWLHEHAADVDPLYHALRRSYALSGWLELGLVHAPALESLRQLLRRKLAQRQLAGADAALEADIAAIQDKLGALTAPPHPPERTPS